MLIKYLKDYLDEGGSFDGPLLVKTCDKSVASNGSNYLTVVLQDISGSITGKKWSIEVGDLDIIVPGSVIRVIGDVFKYKGANQLKIASVIKIGPNDYDPNDFYVRCPLSDQQIKDEINTLLNKVSDSDLKKLAIETIKENQEKYFSYPAAISVHHAYRCGIVYHSICIAKDAQLIASQYPQLNLDYLIVGALLHDIGKIVEMNGITATSYTLRGNLQGHISIGAFIVESVGERLKTPEDKLAVIVHMILSHHGSLEYGSPIVPKTAEALVLHMLDELDAKMFIIDAALKNVNVGEFSQRLPLLDSQAYLKTK